MTTLTALTIGSVDSAVIDGSHKAGSPKRARRSAADSCWITANSATDIDTVTASTIWARHLALALIHHLAPECTDPRLKIA